MEDTVALLWAEASVAGEVGQTSTVRVRTIVGTLIVEYPLIAGTTFDIPTVDWIASGDEIDVQVISVRDGIESLQYQTRRVSLPIIRVPLRAYTLTGYAPTTFKRYSIGVPLGSYALLSAPPDVLRGLLIRPLTGDYSLAGFPAVFEGVSRVSNLNAAMFLRRLPAADVSNLNAVIFFRRDPGADVTNLNAVIFFRL